MSSIQKWNVKGDLIDSCSCEVTCPCNFNSIPTNNHCYAAIGIHIREGKYGDTKLDGLNIVMVADTVQGVIWKGGWTGGAILDEKANPDQRVALETIMTGKAGGQPAVFRVANCENGWNGVRANEFLSR